MNSTNPITRIHLAAVNTLKSWVPLTGVVQIGNIYSPILPGYKPENIRTADARNRPALEVAENSLSGTIDRNSKGAFFDIGFGIRMASGDLREPVINQVMLLCLQALWNGWEGGNCWGIGDLTDRLPAITGQIRQYDGGTTRQEWTTIVNVKIPFVMDRRTFLSMQITQ